MSDLKQQQFYRSELEYEIQKTEDYIKMATIAQYALSIIFITMMVVFGGPLITKAMSNAINMQLEMQQHQLDELRNINQ